MWNEEEETETERIKRRVLKKIHGSRSYFQLEFLIACIGCKKAWYRPLSKIWLEGRKRLDYYELNQRCITNGWTPGLAIHPLCCLWYLCRAQALALFHWIGGGMKNIYSDATGECRLCATMCCKNEPYIVTWKEACWLRASYRMISCVDDDGQGIHIWV